MSSIGTQPDWADVIAEHAAEQATARRLIAQLVAVEVAALAFCRLLERWGRGEAEPSTPGRREAALRLEAELAEGRSWFGDPGAAELVDWEPVLSRAGVRASPHRVAAVYLELAVLVRALEGLAAMVRFASGLDRGSLWAGLFDLRENLLGRVLDDVRALAA